MAGNEHICFPVSTAELERRWKAVRKVMDERGIDALITQSHNSYHSGYFKWFTDMPAFYGGYVSLIFPRDDDMIVVRHGAWRENQVKPGDPVDRGVAKVITRPTFAAVNYTRHYAADAMVDELKRWSGGTVGVVGEHQMAYSFYDRIKSGALSNTRFVDATDMVDEIKAVKSAEEIEMIKACAAMQDTALEEVRKAIKPGKKVYELTALAQYVGELNGSEAGLFLANCGPLGKPARKGNRHTQNRELKDGDQFTILIENNGPGGMYTEIGRTYTIGKTPQKMLDEHAFCLEAQRFTLDLMKPGADPRDILERYNDFMAANGRPKEQRLYAHGQGYDLVERPMIFAEETMKLTANMNFAIHPTYMTESEYSWICDNFIVTETGVEAIHKTPQVVFEV